MRVLGWEEFNVCVGRIANACEGVPYKGVYGVPRGGLCLGVALSHYLDIPLLGEPQPGSLIVDDVYETGLTLNNLRNHHGSRYFVWISKVSPEWWEAIEVMSSSEWIVFPWEDISNAFINEQTYRISRGL